MIEAPPRPAPSAEPPDPEALIEEARQRARLRRIRVALAAGGTLVVAASIAVGIYYLVGGASASGLAPDVSATGPAENGALVFVAPGPSRGIGVDNSELYALGSGGGTPRDLTRTAGAEDDAAWTADGARVVFTREYTTGRANGHVKYHNGVFTMPAGGHAQLIRACGAPCDASDFAWSPDGRQIAFVSGRSGTVMTMNADGSNPRVVCGESRCGQGLAGPQWSPDGSRLLFSNQGVSGFIGPFFLPSGIWVANADGSRVRKLTQPHCRPGHAPLVGCFFDSAPSWSPDGSMIAFSRLDRRLRPSVTSLELMRSDGSHLHALATCEGNRCSQVMAPVWSPEGTRIAFARSAFNDPSIVLATLSGHIDTIRACAGSRCVVPTDLAWSPDGRNLAFLGSSNPSSAWVIGADGRGMHRIATEVECCLAWLPRGAISVPATRHHVTQTQPALALHGTLAFASDQSRPGSAPDEIYELNPQSAGMRRLTYGPRSNFQPAWSPDGRRIAFGGYPGPRNTNVFVANRDGTNQHAITHLASGVTEPAWSPDGRKIAVVTDHGIDIVNSDGGALHTLVAGNARDPAWSPDGRLIAFSRSFAGGSALFTIHPDGGGLLRVTNLPGTQDSPAWSPDGRQIAFVWGSNADDLYLVHPNGTGLRRVTSDPIEAGRPAWSPDGRYLAFTTGYTVDRSTISVAAVASGKVTTLVTIHGEFSDSSDVTWSASSPPATTAGAPAFSGYFSENRIVSIAMDSAAAAGDPTPTLIQHSAVTTRARANLVGEDAGVPGDNPSYLIAMRGHFVGRNSSGPPGHPAPKGSVMTIVVDATTGKVTDGGLGDKYPDLASLGPVSTDSR